MGNHTICHNKWVEIISCVALLGSLSGAPASLAEPTANANRKPPENDQAANWREGQRIRFDLPALRLTDALELYCRHSGAQFLTSEKYIARAVSNRVQGSYSREQALQLLLKNTGYYYQFSGERLITIYAHEVGVTGRHGGAHSGSEPQSETAAVESRALLSELAPGRRELEEIVVTARLHRERQVDSPVAVTWVNIEARSSHGLTDLSESTRFAPNVDFSFGGTSSGSTSAAVMYIRGVGQNDFTPVTDPGVGVYLDGVYLGRTLGSVVEISDLSSIQILRGPQGTLFGRNTVGGAILLETPAPSGEWGSRGAVTLGEQGRRSLMLSGDIPFSDTAGMKVSYVSQRLDDYVKRVLADDGLGNQMADTLRAKAAWTPAENQRLTLSLDATRERENSAPETLTHLYTESDFVRFHNDRVAAETSGIDDCQSAAPQAAFRAGCLNDLYAGAPYTSFETGPSRNDIDLGGLSVTWDADVGGSSSFRSITAWRYIDADFARASDGTPVTVIQTEDTYGQTQFSQELRLLNERDENFFWIGGLFFMQERARNFSVIETTLPIYPIYFGGKTENRNYALFFEGGYKLDSRWRISAGVRQTFEDKAFLPTSISLPSNTPLIDHKEEHLHFNEFTWRYSLQYYPASNASVYLTVSHGFKSGGFVHRYYEYSPDGLVTFEPEYVTQYELGYKLSSPDRGLYLTTLGFYSDYRNIQTASNPLGRPATITDNAARGHISGVEAEIVWSPLTALKIEGAIGLLRTGYDQIGSGNVTVDLDDKFIRSPETSINLGLSYSFPWSNGAELEGRLDWVYRSNIEYEPDNDAHVSEDGYQVYDFNLVYHPPNAVWSLQLGVRNLTDERYMLAGDSNREFGYALAVFARPRNAWLTVSWEF